MSGGSSTSTAPDPNKVVRLANVRQIERTPPHSDEAERSVLSSLFLKPDAVGEAIEKLHATSTLRHGAECFYDLRHQEVFAAMAEMFDKHLPIDPVTVRQHLLDRNKLEAAGGESYLYELCSPLVSVATHLPYYLEIVHTHFIQRKLIEVASQIVADSYDTPTDAVAHLVDRSEEMILSVSPEGASRQTQPARALAKDAMKRIEDAVDRKGAVIGVPSGFLDLDKLTGGFQNSEMIVLAARPGVGKTALALNIIEHAAVEKQMPVAIFSLEMSAVSLVMRMLSSIARVDSDDMRKGFIDTEKTLRLTDAAAKLSKAPLYVDDGSTLDILSLRAKARRLKKQHKIDLFVIDYLQLLHGSTQQRRRQDSRATEIAEISGGMKAMAKELSVPVLVLSQLNRMPAEEGRRPKLHHLRESGAIEQDADVVMLLSRGDSEDNPEKSAEAELDIAKQRNGPTGFVKLTFRGQFTRFLPAAKVRDDEGRDQF